MKKCLVIVATTSVFIGLIISFFVLSHKSTINKEFQSSENLSIKDDFSEICRTSSCVIATSRLYKRLNLNVNPCDNFYDFACGTFVDQTVIHDRKKAYSTVSILQDEIIEEVRRIVTSSVSKKDINPFIVVKEFYQKCINRSEIDQLKSEPLIKVINQLGGMPIITTNWNESTFNWEKTANDFVDSGFVFDYLVEMSMDVDPRNVSRNMIWVHQPLKNFYYNTNYYDFLQEGLANEKIKAYFEYMIELMELLGADSSTSRAEMKDVLEFETSINVISETYGEIESANHYTTINELQKTYPFMDWLKFIRTRVPKEIVIDGNEEILYSGSKYLKSFSELIVTTSNRTIANYLFWRIADYSVDFLSKPFRLVKLKFHQELLGTKTLDEGWKTCIKGAMDNLKHAVGAMYIQEKSEYNDKEGGEKIVKSIIESFKEMTSQSSWMNNTEKTVVDKILKNIKPSIGLPEEYLDNNWLINYYKDIVINHDTSYYNTNLILKRFLLLTEYKILRRSVQDTQWETINDVTVVSSLFITLNSFLSIPVAYLRSPLYSQFVQQYLNFAALGVDAGYSVTYGVSNKLLSMNSQAYQNKSQCFVKQYEEYIKNDQKITINAQDKSRKLVAENVSFKLGYKAYKNWQSLNKDQVKGLPGISYTSEQLYWIAAAQIYCNKDRPEETLRRATVSDHALEQFRVIGSMQNIPEFSQDFKCPLGKYMNPVEKCQIF